MKYENSNKNNKMPIITLIMALVFGGTSFISKKAKEAMKVKADINNEKGKEKKIMLIKEKRIPSFVLSSMQITQHIMKVITCSHNIL